MTEKEFILLKNNPLILGNEISHHIEFYETHISYLLILSEYVYKIKKTVKLPFLDFSELQLRQKACTQELLLNLRTAPSMYIDLYEVKNVQDRISIGGSYGRTIDYAVRMKKADNNLEMDQVLARNEVEKKHMEKLASLVAQFHQKTFAVHKVWDLQGLKDTYNQLQAWSNLAGHALGKDYQRTIHDSCDLSDHFLTKNIDKMNKRSQMSLVRDVHGDLHSRNIFLENNPIIFDCIEFDDDLRQIDLLNEIAFFIMDMEFFGADELARHFYNHYVSMMLAAGYETLEDDAILNYFKMYRASVRAKVGFISLDKQKEETKQQDLGEEITRYLNLVKRYSLLLT
ncbi:hypothetical protein [Catalinimonas niigatensis]|uniref:hypothetical protein n=1 Tax=Catalinimonas niigatensis TaxID=1397264 RepID=UPI0026656027|nr:hypothetical protein [Catalinimonas niigatensis]WPP50802.1 hypothetical protein PZB72_00140 [Catalinimonas niigatensis]